MPGIPRRDSIICFAVLLNKKDSWGSEADEAVLPRDSRGSEADEADLPIKDSHTIWTWRLFCLRIPIRSGRGGRFA